MIFLSNWRSTDGDEMDWLEKKSPVNYLPSQTFLLSNRKKTKEQWFSLLVNYVLHEWQR